MDAADARRPQPGQRRGLALQPAGQPVVRADAAGGGAIRRPGQQRFGDRPGLAPRDGRHRGQPFSGHAFPGHVQSHARAGRPWAGRVAGPGQTLSGGVPAAEPALAAIAGFRPVPRTPGALAGPAAGAAGLPAPDRCVQRADDEVRAACLRSVRRQAHRARRAGPSAQQRARPVRSVDRFGRAGLCRDRLVGRIPRNLWRADQCADAPACGHPA